MRHSVISILVVSVVVPIAYLGHVALIVSFDQLPTTEIYEIPVVGGFLYYFSSSVALFIAFLIGGLFVVYLRSHGWWSFFYVGVSGIFTVSVMHIQIFDDRLMLQVKYWVQYSAPIFGALAGVLLAKRALSRRENMRLPDNGTSE